MSYLTPKYKVTEAENLVSVQPVQPSDCNELTVIIPLRASAERPDILERLQFPKLDKQIPKGISFLVVDDGSSHEESDEISTACKAQGIGYMRLSTGNRIFSVARARNYGAMYSSSKFIMFMDVDLATYDGFYKDVLEEIELNGLRANVRDFLGFGVVYLTEHGSEEFFSTQPNIRRKKFLQCLLENDEAVVCKFSTGTSVQVFHREYYLARGGNNELFSGWGFEDIEFTCRAAHRAGTFPMPRDFLQDYKNCRDIAEYKGFKSLTRLYGDITFAKGITLFHIWHPVQSFSHYMQRKKRNAQLFNELMKEYLLSGTEPEPLPDISAGNTLIFTTSHPAIFNRDIIPRYGNIFYEEESKFSEVESLRIYLDKHNIRRVILQNPYSNDIRLKIYKFLRAENREYYVVERGALPGSIFFDNNGLNADSSSYDSVNWDHSITEEEREAVLRYIEEEISSDSALERQPVRISIRELRRKLKINPNKKVLLVPLQTPADTAVKYFSGERIKSYEEFIELVRTITQRLGEDWVLVYKTHPLTKATSTIEGGICADDYNIKDLLELCNCVLLINSGVGVLSMLWQKPVLYTGRAFYAHEGINKGVCSVDDVISSLENLFIPDSEKIIRFLNFLVNRFYSFGQFTTRTVDWSDAARMTITTGIDFYRINNIGSGRYDSINRAEPKYSTKSILFDRYRFSFAVHKTAHSRSKSGLWPKRMRKLFNNPRKFFEDSRFIFLRPIKHLFSAMP